MSTAAITGLEAWADALAGRDLPVFARSVDALAQLAARQENVTAREIAAVIMRDPMLTLRALRYPHSHHSRRVLADITTVEHAVMMLGIVRFFDAFRDLPIAEPLLAVTPGAQAGLCGVVARARMAALYAGDWAAQRRDIAGDEVVVAALLHDLAELLLWCFAPDQAIAIAGLQRTDRSLRSAEAQRMVLGFDLLELQLELARRWSLPAVLLELMNEREIALPRVQNTALAVALARHAAHGWQDAALPDDFRAVARLLGRPEHEARRRVFLTALEAIYEQTQNGWNETSWLPPLPPEAEQADGPPDRESELARAVRVLERQRDTLQRRQGSLGWTAQRIRAVHGLEAVAAALHGIVYGLGAERAWFIRTRPESAAGHVYALTRIAAGEAALPPAAPGSTAAVVVGSAPDGPFGSFVAAGLDAAARDLVTERMPVLAAAMGETVVAVP